MILVDQSKNYLIRLLGLVMFIALALALTKSSVALAQTPVIYEETGIIETQDLDLLHPTGLAYSPLDNTFFVIPANPTPQSSPNRLLVTLSPFADLIGQVTIPTTVDPLNMAFDSQANRLLLFDPTAGDLLEIKIGQTGLPDPATASRISAQSLGLQHPQGLAFNPAGHLFILDQPGPRLVRIQPDSTPGLSSATALQQGQVSLIDLSALGLGNVRGLGFNPANGHLYLLNPASQSLHELTETGQWVTSHDLSSTRFNNPQGLIFAPSRDSTDDSTRINLFIADNGLNAATATPEENQLYLPLIIKPASAASEATPGATRAETQASARPGQIVELSVAESGLLAPLATVEGTLVKTTLTSQFSSPSPDPSGIAYLASSNTLLISDGEVDEMPQYFTGKNLFQTTLSGSLIHTFTTLPFSYEPAGASYNPTNQHLFISDDTKGKHVYEVNPGADGQYNTADDTITSLTTPNFGSSDPEDVTYGQGHLYVVDGVNEEVYHLTPGANGRFDGVSPEGDDQVTHFDVTSLGLKDPEGIVFNADTGNLYILSGKARLVAETTTGGTLIRTIGIATLPSKALAGVAYAPASNNSGAKNFYIVDRNVDNGTNPNENDGRMFEVSFPSSGGGTAPVTAFTSSSPDSLGQVTSFSNSSTGSNLSFQWNFGDGSALSTAANPSHTYAAAGTFTVALTATNSAGSSTALGSVLIQNQPPPPPPAQGLYLSLANSGSYNVGAATAVRDEDIISFDGTNFALVFDGSDVGVGGLDLDAFAFLDADSLLMSFNTAATLGSLGTVDAADIVRFDASTLGSNTSGTFSSLFFDGSAVGLEASSENIDAFELLADGRLLVSTTGNASVPGVAGADEDLLAFTPGSGTWALYFDGSDVDLSTTSDEDVNGVDVTANGDIYLTTLGDFAVTGVSGAKEDVFICAPTALGNTTACTYSPALFFDGSAWGLTGNDVDAIGFLP